jgi:nucleoside-diphosphate-sugar epimerase
MIVITGASGLIGRALAARALQEGKDVRLQGRSVEKVANALYTLKVHTDLEVVELDLNTADQTKYDRLMNGCSTVIHCAGLVHKSDAPAAQYDALNYRATQLVAAAAKRAKADCFVFLSTSAVYGGGPFVDVDESAPLHGDTPYAVSKIRCEQWLKENPPAPKTVILRPSLVFGEGDRGNLLSLIKQINKGMYFHIGGNNAKKSLIYAGDVALAIDRCISQLGAGYHVFNLANPRTIDVNELSNTIAVCLGKAPPPTVPEAIVRAGAMLGGAILGDKSPLTVEKMGKLMTTTTCSIKQLVSTTGFVPAFPLDEAIGAEIQWARAKGILGTTELKSYR